MESLPYIMPRKCPKCENSLYNLQKKCFHCNQDIEWKYNAECKNCKSIVDHTKKNCQYCGIKLNVWEVLIQEALTKPPRKNIKISKKDICNPKNYGFREIKGEPKSQIQDYDKSLPKGGRIHIIEYKNQYQLHWDRNYPSEYKSGNLITILTY